MKQTLFLLVVVVLAACASGEREWHGSARGMRGDPTGTAAGIKQMLVFDANKDGDVARAEMEAGVKAQFAVLDSDSNGKLDAGETRAENERRYKESGTQYQPLLDWNQDGVIDFGEFAGSTRSLYEQLDRDHDGLLSGRELKPPRGPRLEEPKKVVPDRSGGEVPSLDSMGGGA